MTQIRLETRIDATVEECFALSLSVDAHTASMRRSRERIIGGVRSGQMALGETVTWRAVHWGIPWRMTSKISRLDAPHSFVDEQLRGPFAKWWHEHQFTKTPEGTLMVDVVDFRAPGGPIGRIAERLFLRRYMTMLLERRNAWLAEELQRL